MLGMVVEVWTSDDQRFLYEITEVRRHQLDLNDAIAATEEQSGSRRRRGRRARPARPRSSPQPISQEAADPADAHPDAEAGRLRLSRRDGEAAAAVAVSPGRAPGPPARRRRAGPTGRTRAGSSAPVAAARPPHSSAPWRSAGVSVAGSRMNM